MRPTAYLFAFALVACGGGDSGPPQNNIDAPPDEPPIDAPDIKEDAAIDAPPAPDMITLTGTANEQSIAGATPVADATIQAFSNADEQTPIATTTTDADGNFTLVVDTGGVAISGFLKATKANLVDTYLYPPSFIDADLADIPILMVAPGTYDALSTIAQGNQMNENGLIAMQVLEGPPTPTTMTVAGATVTSNPAATAYRYNGDNGLPSATATETAADGIAYMFNVPPNVAVDVTAMAPGLAFPTHTVKARPGSLTTTLTHP